jgi:hypothetical protein
VYGLICKDLKRFWAKIKKKGLNCKETSKVEGYFCEYWKTWGVYRKTAGPAGV